MSKLRFVLPSSFLLAIVASMLACGINQGLYKSLTVSPATADAQNYPNGQVQFTATGTEINGTQVKPLASFWTPGPPWLPSPALPLSGVQLDQTGLASCGTAGPGTYMIVATAPVDPHLPVSKMTPSTPHLSGAATLTCP
jgi:hypothetical protein